MENLVFENFLLAGKVITSLALTIDVTLYILILVRKFFNVGIN